ncbi:hypothetical protein GCM10007981_14070 [Thermocladium modestius]|uniref:MEMO1 family protein GCM10007981_14070 n=1 Tax=Thermocladium modestius TaxID=62609 RepID=A0A830GXC4_9CREN|nr:AmmeMemoRadiSam system protein B [Thermocladium modestius]GGP21600.1 hypothetical protein GCM10007981_14070 [Thermocladium modestius]
MVVKRRPAVAGAFYEDDGELLRNRIEWSINHELGPARNPRSIGDPVAVVVPHAGLIYSGPIAAHSYVAIKKRLSPSTFIIMGPNHYGVGAPVAVMNEGVWETPLGDIEIDSSIANELMKSFEGLEVDSFAFEREHSVEVQVPFIQHLFPGSKIVPIVVWEQTLDVARRMAQALVSVIGNRKDVVFVASSDLNHYEPHDVTSEKDMKAIERIIKLDSEGLMDIMDRLNISICGFGAILTAMEYSKLRGIKHVDLLMHATSGDTGPNKMETVGYASIAFHVGDDYQH